MSVEFQEQMRYYPWDIRTDVGYCEPLTVLGRVAGPDHELAFQCNDCTVEVAPWAEKVLAPDILPQTPWGWSLVGDHRLSKMRQKIVARYDIQRFSPQTICIIML